MGLCSSATRPSACKVNLPSGRREAHIFSSIGSLVVAASAAAESAMNLLTAGSTFVKIPSGIEKVIGADGSDQMLCVESVITTRMRPFSARFFASAPSSTVKPRLPDSTWTSLSK